jgi:ribosomal protein L17
MEFLAKLAGKRDVQPPPLPPQITRFEEFLAKVRGERERFESLVTVLKGDDVEAVPQVIARLEERAAALTQLVEDIGDRAEQARQSAAGVEALATRIASLEGHVLRAEVRASEDAQRADEMDRRAEGLEALVSGA